MPHGSDDLLPLFISEASDRLDRLDEILAQGPQELDSEIWKSARRELHTLKGAGRMMGLLEFAEVCHQAEDAFDAVADIDFEDLLSRVELVRSNLKSIRKETPPEVKGSGESTYQLRTAEPAVQTRVPGDVLDRVSDQAVRLSFLSKGVAAMVEDLYATARSAETGASGDNPEQVLATLAHRLRRVALKADQARNRFDRLIEQQLASLLSIQVQPIRPLLTGLGRHGVELAQSLGKSVKIKVVSTDCRIDQRIMAALKEALLHLVTNAVDHGIEPESERQSLGKKGSGKIVLKAETLSERVQLTVEDDGRGIDPSTILTTAVERGLVSKERAESMSDDAVRQLIFESGFSTTATATTISGRGVGLDSVADAVRRVGGDVWIDSTPGQGMRITLDLPISRRGESILVVKVGQYILGIPSHQILGFSGFNSHDSNSFADRAEGIGASDITLIDLVEKLGLPPDRSKVVIHTNSGGVSVDLEVTEVIGQEEVFLHPWPSFLGKDSGAEALALLADGTPVEVLDVRHFLKPEAQGERQPGEVPPRSETLKILLVDDSKITREMFRRILLDADFEVTSVSSAEEALVVFENNKIDCLVTDIEMPGMNGLELTRQVRASPRWEHLPVVVVSTRDQPDDRLAGLNAGADAYLAKQNLMGEDLIALVLRLGGRS